MNPTGKGAQRINRPRTVFLFLTLSLVLICLPAYSQQPASVVVYENPDFGGRSKILAVGNNTLSDFEGLVSSIKVPPGLAVVIFEHADDAGGYGMSVDLLEDCANLAAYKLDNKVAYATVFNATKPDGLIWARNGLRNGEFVPGHWERASASGNAANRVAVVSPPLPGRGHPRPVIPTSDPQPTSTSSDPGDLMGSPPANQSEMEEFNSIRDNQYSVAVLGGDTKKPFYYHHNQPGETVYKYKKVVDMQYFDGAGINLLTHELGRYHALAVPLEELVDFSHDIQHAAIDIFETLTFTHGATLKAVDTWYPDSEIKTTVCGTMKEDAHVCGQDYVHTKVIVDKDMNFDLVPNEKFKPMLKNRWAVVDQDYIEGEVKATNVQDFNTHTSWITETLIPKNPILRDTVKEKDAVCMYGPWMADILDLNAKVPIPLSSQKLEVANIDIRNNNEIHPINQMWIKRGDETQLISVVDKTGYFDKASATEVQASGYNQHMRYYLAFQISPNDTTVQEYQVNGIGYDFSAHPSTDVQTNVITLRYKGRVCLKIDDNSALKLQKTHKIFFDKTRTRPDGSVQGYIVVETEPIDVHGGSINIFVKKVQ
jgi:hypothetical protein